MNLKLQHALAEIAQIGGTLAGVATFAGTINPVAGSLCVLAGAIATFIKPFITQKIINVTPGVSVVSPIAGS